MEDQQVAHPARSEAAETVRNHTPILCREATTKPIGRLLIAPTAALQHGSTADVIGSAGSAINFTMGTLIGSYASVARMLDEMATVTATKGIMMVFDDFVIGVEQFGRHIQPLMRSRQDRLAAVA